MTIKERLAKSYKVAKSNKKSMKIKLTFQSKSTALVILDNYATKGTENQNF